MTIQARHYTADEFWAMARRSQDDRCIELVNGVLHEMNPPSKKNSYLAAQLVRLLGNDVTEHQLGYVFGADGGYTFSDDNVRIPDASFVSKKRLAKLSDTEIIATPDLAIEVISPHESTRMIHDKTALYLHAGTRQVWHVYPDDNVIAVWQQVEGGKLQMQKFINADVIDGADVLPGFQFHVQDLFTDV